ncbi:MAG: hypothetical protein ABS69_09035 [Nitrosomonadales bacterium SCN 54-20]|nr:MAG: hypothetical protein ABS69_09035 [Nitrosomonadales bacterium SCN 54-20]
MRPFAQPSGLFTPGPLPSGGSALEMAGANPRKAPSIATAKWRRDETAPARMVDISLSAGRTGKPACSSLLLAFTFDSFLIVKNQVSKKAAINL